tara:strand:+ start:203 stop:706 length:504 start_codon:yes stop_codon:yes gene_type:complete
MIRKNKKILIFFTIFCLPLVIISSPEWFELNGISPCWPVIFLLPFSLKSNPYRSAFISIFLGIFIDSFILSDASYIPSLLIFSLVCSQYGLSKKKIDLFLNIGLISMFGTALVGISMWFQEIILHSILRNNWFHSWSIYVVIAEVIITGLVAPFVSTWLFLLIKKTN